MQNTFNNKVVLDEQTFKEAIKTINANEKAIENSLIIEFKNKYPKLTKKLEEKALIIRCIIPSMFDDSTMVIFENGKTLYRFNKDFTHLEGKLP